MSNRTPNYTVSDTMSTYQPEGQAKKEWTPSEFWFNYGTMKENPVTGEEAFVPVTNFGIPLDNAQSKPVCNDGSWFAEMVLAGNAYFEKIKKQALALKPGECKYCRIANSKYAFQILRKKDKTTTADMSKNMAYDDSLFNFE